MKDFGTILLAIGGVLVLLGLVFAYAPGLISWFGRLPGDFRFEGTRVSFYFPLTSLLLLNLLFFLVARFFRR